MVASVTSSEDALRRRWFERGVHALSCVAEGIRDDLGEVYVCPLCLGIHTNESLKNGQLTFEHAPPENVGGDRVVLTCKDCNSTAGHRLDSHIEIQAAHRDFLAGREGRPIKGATVHGGVTVRGNLRRTADGGFAFSWVDQANNPADLRRAEEVLEQAGPGHTFELRSLESWNPRRANLGWVRAAYVLAFAWFGYRYILLRVFERLREQLREPDEPVVPELPLLIDPRREPNWRRFGELAEPLRCVVVEMGAHSVLLPPPGERDEQFVETIRTRFLELPESSKFEVDGIPGARLTGRDYPWPTWPNMVLDG